MLGGEFDTVKELTDTNNTKRVALLRREGVRGNSWRDHKVIEDVKTYYMHIICDHREFAEFNR